jgi:hypothetical protein
MLRCFIKYTRNNPPKISLYVLQLLKLFLEETCYITITSLPKKTTQVYITTWKASILIVLFLKVLEILEYFK